MLEEQIEYFRGNKQEIENEKQRKRELMFYFPKMLGTVDKTRYVLQDDEKPKLENDFESKPISPLTFEPVKNASALNRLGVGESQSYKTKKEQVGQIPLKPSSGNAEKEYDFDPWKREKTLDEIHRADKDWLIEQILIDRYNNYRKIVANDGSQINNFAGWINRLNKVAEIVGSKLRFDKKY